MTSCGDVTEQVSSSARLCGWRRCWTQSWPGRQMWAEGKVSRPLSRGSWAPFWPIIFSLRWFWLHRSFMNRVRRPEFSSRPGLQLQGIERLMGQPQTLVSLGHMWENWWHQTLKSVRHPDKRPSEWGTLRVAQPADTPREPSPELCRGRTALQ